MFIDCDVHQGNGTSSVAKTDATLFSFSIHCETNFPFRKTSGDLDVAVPERAGDRDYLDLLEQGLQQAFLRFQPDIVFYLAGADPYGGDRLGRLNLTKHGLIVRDQLVLDFCRQKSIPVALSMAGGYAPQVSDIVDIHFNTVNVARQSFFQVHSA